MKKKTLTAIAVAAVFGGTVLAGVSYAVHRGGDSLEFLGKAPFAVTAMEISDAIDTDRDGKLTQAEIDRLRDEHHVTHDANGDGDLSLDEFAGLWYEITRPLTVRAFQMLDTDGNAIVTRTEYDRPFTGIVERFDRNDDGSLSLRDRWDDDDDWRWWDDD